MISLERISCRLRQLTGLPATRPSSALASLASPRSDVEEADSAETALTLAPFDRFDCVVTDYLMPGMNGVELARRLHAEHPALPILLLSGYADLEAFSALPYVSKPCFGDDLTRAITGLMAGAD